MNQNTAKFYNDKANFAKYLERREWKENANDTLEKPVMCKLVGEVAGKRILDLGCGDARFAKDLFASGCEEYVGIDGSANMVHVASHSLKGLNARVIQATMESWEYPESTFDLVISRLAIHYIEDLDNLFQKIGRTLKPDGRFIFSVGRDGTEISSHH